jgi:type I restriction enzyme R subunit
MSAPGEIERHTQDRMVALLRKDLAYAYYGDWTERANSNIEEEALRAWLTRSQGCDKAKAERVIDALKRAAGGTQRQLYDRNRDVYDLLRYGVKVRPAAGEQHETVWLIDWDHPERNQFAVAEEVTIEGSLVTAHPKRPDIVVYVNGIALAVIELKRSIVSVAEGIRQNIDSQRPEFIQGFFSTIQMLGAGNDTEGFRYGVIGTPEKKYLTWKEPSEVENPLDRAVGQVFSKARFLELLHDFIVFDAGEKKICRPHQYIGIKAAQDFVARREGGIIWHAQGTGKSLEMVWLAKWIYEHVTEPRVLVVTDRIELDEQIEGKFLGVNEQIVRTRSGADLIAKLNAAEPWLMCSLIHKFGGANREDGGDIPSYIAELKRAIPAGFAPKGNFVVFVDECHRTQSNILHEAMKEILPDATFIGFTGTPLLRADKKSIEVFGRYIHSYRFDEAVTDKVILDLRYEARGIDQRIVSQERIDAWFEAKTKGLTELARAHLKRRWGTLQEVFSSRSRLEQIVSDVLLDMETRDRLASGYGNALLVSDSIYNACKFYELFCQGGLRGKCAIVTSYRPTPAALKGEDSGEGDTERLAQYGIYQQMLATWFGEAPEVAVTKADLFEKEVKQKFIYEPRQMKLLIVVDKLLTGFDAPSATYLYIDKAMRDHGLFQAICRVNRLDTPDKEFGYIIDYRDLFRSLALAVDDYTSGAFDGYERVDIAGLLKSRLETARQRLDTLREQVKGLCEPVALPRDSAAYLRYFCAQESGNETQLRDNEHNRVALYNLVGSLVRAYAEIASELEEAGYKPEEIEAIRAEVDHYEKVRTEVRLASGDYVDLKMYEPAMRHLIDTYIAAEASEKVSAFDDLSLVQIIVERGVGELERRLPPGLRGNQSAAAEAIENNVRRLLVDRTPINPRYYVQMSQLLGELIDERRRGAIGYADYLKKIEVIARDATNGPKAGAYPAAINTAPRRALYDNTGCDEGLAVALDEAIVGSRQDGWRDSQVKLRRVRSAIEKVLGADETLIADVLDLAKTQREY